MIGVVADLQQALLFTRLGKVLLGHLELLPARPVQGVDCRRPPAKRDLLAPIGRKPSQSN